MHSGVYIWSENLYFSHRIHEFSEEGLKPDFDLLFFNFKKINSDRNQNNLTE